VYQESGQVENAIDAYREAIAAAGPDLSSDIVANLGFLYFEIGRLDDAENAANIALTGSGDKARSLLARIAGTRGDLPRAERIARELADSPTASPADMLLLAEVMQARGNHAEALVLVGRAEARAQIPVYNLEALRGESLARLERHQEAMAAFEREVRLFPHNLSAWDSLVILQFVGGDRDAADRTLQRMVQANPSPRAQELARSIREKLR
jgi:tetratricopeptide (TPR) repeat protein